MRQFRWIHTPVRQMGRPRTGIGLQAAARADLRRLAQGCAHPRVVDQEVGAKWRAAGSGGNVCAQTTLPAITGADGRLDTMNLLWEFGSLCQPVVFCRMPMSSCTKPGLGD